jgi:hypothetical protein
MKIHREDTAIVFIDSQNEVLSEKGSAWHQESGTLWSHGCTKNLLDFILETGRFLGPQCVEVTLSA